MRPLQVVLSGSPAERTEVRRRVIAWLAAQVLPRAMARVGEVTAGDGGGDLRPGEHGGPGA